jgi:hypothetical protein
MGTQLAPDGDELRARHYLHRAGARPLGHQPPSATCPPPDNPPDEDSVMLLALILAGLTPGVATTWLLRTRGWPLAVLAGLAVTISLPGLLIVAMLLFPPLGVAVALAALLAAVRAYDDGRIWIATAWAATTVVALACVGVAL